MLFFAIHKYNYFDSYFSPKVFDFAASLYESVDREKHTAFANIVQTLIEKGANTNVIDSNGDTALILAAEHGKH